LAKRGVRCHGVVVFEANYQGGFVPELRNRVELRRGEEERVCGPERKVG
jgi:hypothetical protein